MQALSNLNYTFFGIFMDTGTHEIRPSDLGQKAYHSYCQLQAVKNYITPLHTPLPRPSVQDLAPGASCKFIFVATTKYFYGKGVCQSLE